MKVRAIEEAERFAAERKQKLRSLEKGNKINLQKQDFDKASAQNEAKEEAVESQEEKRPPTFKSKVELELMRECMRSRVQAERATTERRKLRDAFQNEAKKRKAAENIAKQLALMQKLSSAKQQLAPSIVSFSQGAIWQYEEYGTWQTLPPEGTGQMLDAYIAYLRQPTIEKRIVTITSAGVSRKVDFHLMQQTRCDTSTVRRLRIELGVPKEWISAPPSLLLQTNQLESFYVEVTDSNIHDKVREILLYTGHAQDSKQKCSCMHTAKVKSVHRIENWRLWQKYKGRREEIRSGHATNKVSPTPVTLDLDAFDAGRGAPTEVMANSQNTFDCGEALHTNERFLLHGTRWDSANAIVVHGFDPRTCTRGMYGDGVYFAGAACKSHQYTCSVHTSACGCKGERTLIIARCCLGDPYFAKEVLYHQRRPPLRSNTLGATYDSVVVNPGRVKGHQQGCQTHQEFVIFGEAAYPSYVVQYELWPSRYVEMTEDYWPCLMLQKCGRADSCCCSLKIVWYQSFWKSDVDCLGPSSDPTIGCHKWKDQSGFTKSTLQGPRVEPM